jgi:hypothetical protein
MGMRFLVTKLSNRVLMYRRLKIFLTSSLTVPFVKDKQRYDCRYDSPILGLLSSLRHDEFAKFDTLSLVRE